MIKQLWGGVGTGLFWLSWPVWVLYFRLSGKRSRVLVIVENEVLIMQSWLGSKNFGLPGGGTTKNETTLSAAVRELHEETDIEAAESSMTYLGSRLNKRYKFRYRSDFFVLQLAEKPELHLRRLEVFSIKWIPLAETANYKFDDDASYAFRRYQPPEQASLL